MACEHLAQIGSMNLLCHLQSASRKARVHPTMNLRKVTLAVTVATAALGWTARSSIVAAEPSKAAAGGQPVAEVSWVATPQRLKVEAFRSAAADAHPTLIVILHGDSPFAPPTYQYRFAQRVAANTDNVIAAAILRPGYSDGADRSEGKRGWRPATTTPRT